MEPFVLRTARLKLDQPVSADVDDIPRYCADPVFERTTGLAPCLVPEPRAHLTLRIAPVEGVRCGGSRIESLHG